MLMLQKAQSCWAGKGSAGGQSEAGSWWRPRLLHSSRWEAMWEPEVEKSLELLKKTKWGT